MIYNGIVFVLTINKDNLIKYNACQGYGDNRYNLTEFRTNKDRLIHMNMFEVIELKSKKSLVCVKCYIHRQEIEIKASVTGNDLRQTPDNDSSVNKSRTLTVLTGHLNVSLFEPDLMCL